MPVKKLKELIKQGKTVLGVGPVSLNTVNAAVEISDERDIPLMLIASRRQIDDENIQRGYVNNWSTDEFVRYVRKTQKTNNIILARDHGGPWQNNIEITKRLSLKEAMKSAQESYQKDIEAGFDILHIDPSIDISMQISEEIILERLMVLYDFCSSYGRKLNKSLEFEAGTEEQMIHANNIAALSDTLKKIYSFCTENNYKLPLFTVVQIGTKVMEMKNVGILNSAGNIKIFEEIKELCSAAHKNNFFVKVHNSDYLDLEILKRFPSLGINAANIAPEFGVCETKAFIGILEKYGLISLENEFLELSYNSGKWKKWLIKGSRLSKRDKAVISGHYVFAYDEFEKIKETARGKIKSLDIDEFLKNEIKQNILKYLYCFNILKKEKVSAGAAW